MLFKIILLGLLDGALVAVPKPAQAKKEKSITLTQIGRYEAGAGGTRAEIAAYDPATKRLFAINAAQFRLDVLALSTPEQPVPRSRQFLLEAVCCLTASLFTTASSPSHYNKSIQIKLVPV